MDFSAANKELWNPMIQMGIISGLVLLANILRRKIPFVRKSLMPTAVLAGFILLFLKSSGILKIDAVFLESITYHALALGFIALSLRVETKEENTSGVQGYKSGALIVSTYLVQVFVGLVVSLLFAYTIKPEFFKAAGVLLAMAYGQGPGQANNVGTTYELLGMDGGRSFGLSLAAVGYLVACFAGVIYLNILNRKKSVVRIHDKEEMSGSVTVDHFQDSNEIPVAQSIDRLSIQAALIALVYLCTFLFIWGITELVGMISPGLADTLGNLLWGFNFIVGSLLASLFANAFKGLRKVKLMNRQYQNNYLLSRLSGLAFDFMIVAGIASINIEDLSGSWLPFIIMAVLGGIATFVYLKFMCDKLYKGYEKEAFFSMFGMLTGTISSGVLLLREIDPELKTPASSNLVLGSSFGVGFGFPVLFLVNFAGKSEMAVWICFGIVLVYLALLLFLIFKTGKKNKVQK